MKKLMLFLGLCILTGKAHAAAQPQNGDQFGNYGVILPYVTEVSSRGATGMSQVTSSFTANSPYSGVTQYAYITSLYVTAYSSAAITVTATPSSCTVQNLPGSPVYSFPMNQTAGGVYQMIRNFDLPLRATQAGQGVLVNCWANPAILWDVKITGYLDN